MAGLTIKQSKKDKTLQIDLIGTVDESASYADISFMGVSKLVINTRDLTSINSWGVREWVRWVRTFPLGMETTLVECASILVDNINMIAGFLPRGAAVESFFVPYYCNSCNHSGEYLFESDIDVKNGNIVESRSATCENCNRPAEWDIIASSYFRFLKK